MRDTIIIVLLIVLIGLYIWDMYRREHFMGFASVNYNTENVRCDNLTGSDPCVVKTVKPKRDIVCNKKFDVVNQQSEHTEYDKSGRPNPRTIRRRLVDNGMRMDLDGNLDENLINDIDDMNRADNSSSRSENKDMKITMKNKQCDSALSSDELDILSMDQMDMSNMNVQKMDDMMNLMSDDVSYQVNNDKHNKKVKSCIDIDSNTLSDVEQELMSLN